MLRHLAVFRRCLPTAIVTANYLSGGQSLPDASARLNAINKHKTAKDPWNLSFSWSAALQMPLFQLCEGKDGLQLEAMSELYLKELAIASAAARAVQHRQSHVPGAGNRDLSGGQSLPDASRYPWNLSFSWSAALQCRYFTAFELAIALNTSQERARAITRFASIMSYVLLLRIVCFLHVHHLLRHSYL